VRACAVAVGIAATTGRTAGAHDFTRGNADRFGQRPRRLPELELELQLQLQRLRARTPAPVHSTGEQNNADPVAENEARQKKKSDSTRYLKTKKKVVANLLAPVSSEKRKLI
jgi:hypothetical protein